MITKEDILIDMHTHSIFSKHAFSTIEENIKEAKNKNLKYMVVSDHFIGNGDYIDKKNEVDRIINIQKRINRFDQSFKIIGSAEFNLNQDIENWNKLKNLKWKPVGLHTWFVDTNLLDLEDAYDLFIKAYDKYSFNCFVHIDREFENFKDGKYINKDISIIKKEVQEWFYQICTFAKRNDIFIEINEGSLVNDVCGGINRVKVLLEIAKENKNIITLGTDAHYSKEVGDFSIGLQLLNEIDFPKKLILNCDEEMIKTFI